MEKHRHKDPAYKLSELGYRMTPQRMMILNAVHNATDHISAEEIYSQVRPIYSHLNLSTVYRTLELLKNLKLVTESDFGDGKVRYHSAEKGRHHHLVCQKCGDVVDVDESVFTSLTDKLSGDYNFTADLRHLTIFGQCSKCSKDKK
jgi:Fur family ferric uptake transcriptional regulator